jgi:hypothetical protein
MVELNGAVPRGWVCSNKETERSAKRDQLVRRMFRDKRHLVRETLLLDDDQGLVYDGMER